MKRVPCRALFTRNIRNMQHLSADGLTQHAACLAPHLSWKNHKRAGSPKLGHSYSRDVLGHGRVGGGEAPGHVDHG